MNQFESRKRFSPSRSSQNRILEPKNSWCWKTSGVSVPVITGWILLLGHLTQRWTNFMLTEELNIPMLNVCITFSLAVWIRGLSYFGGLMWLTPSLMWGHCSCLAPLLLVSLYLTDTKTCYTSDITCKCGYQCGLDLWTNYQPQKCANRREHCVIAH